MQAAEFVAEVEKDEFQSVMVRCAELHPDHTLGVMVDKLDGYLRQQESKGYRDSMRNGISTAGGFRSGLCKHGMSRLFVNRPPPLNCAEIMLSKGSELIWVTAAHLGQTGHCTMFM